MMQLNLQKENLQCFKLVRFNLKKRVQSKSFWILAILNTIFMLISMLIPYIIAARSSDTSSILVSPFYYGFISLRYFTSFIIIIYAITSCYVLINRPLTSGSTLTLMSRSFTRKNIIKAGLISVISDCLMFVLFNFILIVIVFLVASAFFWNKTFAIYTGTQFNKVFAGITVPIVANFTTGAFHQVIGRSIGLIAIVYAGVALLLPIYILPLFIVSYRNSSLLLYGVGIFQVIFFGFLLQLIDVLVTAIGGYTDASIALGNINAAVGLANPSYWLFAIGSGIFNFSGTAFASINGAIPNVNGQTFAPFQQAFYLNLAPGQTSKTFVGLFAGYYAWIVVWTISVYIGMVLFYRYIVNKLQII